MAKFNKLLMFFIILGTLMLCNCLGGSMREGLDSSSDISAEDNQGDQDVASDSTSLKGGIEYGTLLETGTEQMEEGNNADDNSDIPEGDNHLYMLKSQMVPPVCPACPTVQACPRQEKCPPCPPCARCPEPSFECKKVPNYTSNNNDRLPRPILADFSQFGM
jgi:hypothetical protein